MTMRVELLGPFRASMGGEAVAVPAGRLRALLAALALSAGQPVSVDRLTTAVWGEDPAVDARVSLQANVRRLRRLLGAELVATRGGGYALEVAPGQVDALRFDRLLAEAAAAPDPETQRDRLVAALALWRGTPFDGVRSDWLEQTQAPRLRERYLAAVERRIDLDLARGSVDDLATELGELTGRYPLREPLWVRLLVALSRSGRPAEALERYQAVRAVLAEELGTDPGPDLRRLHADLLAGRSPRLPAGATPAVATPAVARAEPRAGPRVVPRQLPADPAVFTGREAALKVLDGLLRESGQAGVAGGPGSQPPGQLVVCAIVGTAGIGKSALAVHWAHRVAGRFPDGQLYVNLRGFDPTGSPVEPGVAIRGFLDALEVPPQQVPAGPESQAGLYRSLLAGRRMLVLLDNARDADQVAPLLPGAPGCLVIVTSRHQLPGLVAAGADLIALDLLGHDEAVQLLARRLSHDRVAAEPGPTSDLVTRCDGLPLALAIVAARAAAAPELPLATLADQLREAGDGLDGFDAGDTATSARTVFSWSYRSLCAPAARLFRLLGLHPGPDLALAAAASLAGLPAAQVRPLLADLTRAHLIAEPAAGRYAFHDLLRAYASELALHCDPEPDRRAAIHRLLDHYVHTAHAADLRLYQHGEAIPLSPARPGVTVERLDNQDRAMAWFTAEHQPLLAAAGQAARAGLHRHTCHLAWALSLFLHRRGYWRERAALQQAALDAASRLADRAGQARAHRYLAGALTDLGRFDDAHRHFDGALELSVATGDLGGEAHTHYERSLAHGLAGRTADALDAAREAYHRFQAAGDRAGQATALTDAGWYQGRLGDHRQAVVLLEDALALHQRLGNRPYQAHTFSCLGETHAQRGDRAQAVACYQQALALFGEIGDSYGEASTLAHLAAIHLISGDHAAARDARRRSQEILAALDPPAAAQADGQLRHLDRPAAPPQVE